MRISAEKARYASRWVTIGAVALTVLTGICASIKGNASSLGIDFEVEVRTHEHDRIEYEARDRDNSRAYDRVQEYHRDPDRNQKPDRSDYEKSYDYFRDNISLLMKKYALLCLMDDLGPRDFDPCDLPFNDIENWYGTDKAFDGGKYRDSMENPDIDYSCDRD